MHHKGCFSHVQWKLAPHVPLLPPLVKVPLPKVSIKRLSPSFWFYKFTSIILKTKTKFQCTMNIRCNSFHYEHVLGINSKVPTLLHTTHIRSGRVTTSPLKAKPPQNRPKTSTPFHNFFRKNSYLFCRLRLYIR